MKIIFGELCVAYFYINGIMSVTGMPILCITWDECDEKKTTEK